MGNPRPNRLADLLTAHKDRLGIGDAKLAKRASEHVGIATYVTRSTVRNWAQGSSASVSNWRQLAAIASALQLDLASADELLSAGGCTPITELLRLELPDDDHKFVAGWRPGELEPGLAPLIVTNHASVASTADDAFNSTVVIGSEAPTAVVTSTAVAASVEASAPVAQHRELVADVPAAPEAAPTIDLRSTALSQPPIVDGRAQVRRVAPATPRPPKDTTATSMLPPIVVSPAAPTASPAPRSRVALFMGLVAVVGIGLALLVALGSSASESATSSSEITTTESGVDEVAATADPPQPVTGEESSPTSEEPPTSPDEVAAAADPPIDDSAPQQPAAAGPPTTAAQLPPTTTVDSPLPNQTIGGVIIASGTASGQGQLDHVEVTIKNNDIDQYWNPNAGVWQSSFARFTVALDFADEARTSASWSYQMPVPVSSGSYRVRAWTRATDRSVDPLGPKSDFSVANESIVAVDPVPAEPGVHTVIGSDLASSPTVEISAPILNQNVGPGFVATGTATDPSGVSFVEITFKNLDDATYWNPETAQWQPDFIRFSSQVISPGAETTDWEFRSPDALSPGNYRVRVWGVRADGGRGDQGPRVDFAVTE